MVQFPDLRILASTSVLNPSALFYFSPCLYRVLLFNSFSDFAILFKIRGTVEIVLRIISISSFYDLEEITFTVYDFGEGCFLQS